MLECEGCHIPLKTLAEKYTQPSKGKKRIVTQSTKVKECFSPWRNVTMCGESCISLGYCHISCDLGTSPELARRMLDLCYWYW